MKFRDLNGEEVCRLAIERHYTLARVCLSVDNFVTLAR